jgi:hypothetical protein
VQKRNWNRTLNDWTTSASCCTDTTFCLGIIISITGVCFNNSASGTGVSRISELASPLDMLSCDGMRQVLAMGDGNAPAAATRRDETAAATKMYEVIRNVTVTGT